MSEPTGATYTVLRYYLEGGRPKVEAVLWKWVRGSLEDAALGLADPGEVARARPLPAEVEPGMVPNQWVWVQGNDLAAKMPRPEVTQTTVSRPDGEVVDAVEHRHPEGSKYWDLYKLPLRTGVELIDQETWAAAVAAQKAQDEAKTAERANAAAEARTARAEAAEAARKKLAVLGLTEAEISALIR